MVHPDEKPIVKLTGHEGNSFVILYRVKQAFNVDENLFMVYAAAQNQMFQMLVIYFINNCGQRFSHPR